MRIANIIAWIFLIIGGINWLLVGLFSWNLVTAIFGGITLLTRVIYCLVGLSAIWLLISPFAFGGRISLWGHDDGYNR
ncbi:MAG: DUF378 domain-containing protein [Clostridia bacterium]|nr:DUF378 domain-containing protein [Clostridia bacterium]